jgi:hypothetical protein
MTLLPSTKAHSPSLSHFHPYNRSSWATTPSLNPGVSPTLPGSSFARPFDRFTANGGGASGDIFRLFKIHKSEEEHFIVHWVRQPLSPGLLTRDENGTLVFRVSSSDISYISTLKIGHPDSELDSGVEVEWTHVYDEQGISWLSRCRGTDYSAEEIDMYAVLDEQYERFIRERSAIIGMCGPSGLTPAEFYRLRVAEGRGQGFGQSSASESN